MDEELTAIAALIAEGDRLRAELAQRDDLIAAFEARLNIAYANWTKPSSLQRHWRKMKAQHLGTKAEVE